MQYEEKTLLVTGGAGFIGSNFIHYLMSMDQNINIINIDALTYAANLENISCFNDSKNYSFFKSSICDKKGVSDVIEKFSPDIIVNFAAESHVDRSITDPDIFLTTNVLGTHNLLNAAERHGIDKFIQISTDEVYGTLGDMGYFTEGSQLSPSSPYSASKAAADMVVLSYFKTYDLPVNITRCSNNYGPYQHTEKLIPLVISKCLKKEAIPVYGDGLNIRDWLYVDDHCSAICNVINNGKIGDVYNIGANNEIRNIDLVRKIISCLNDKLPSLNLSYDLIRYVSDRKGHDRRYAIDSTKIRNDLGWKPTVNFDEGLNRTVDWYLKFFNISI
ncbi:dTDP-glucose 4,6-dehydratase [Methanoplanus limicola]|uniref:dTDP-glucose 4,6-dehydratase n=1 Tax=Methanoplanus limicola DSM 2279 TaxID=937775 RepID=H1Z1W9_9EURY|nr:dTDP-glucose 4,6-dehydratase [Methanoplanus limicola]EHQ35436.1 dTDP-glucose 4,6-dehydratase [Methanoplanus limicola DSM 2279]